MTVPGPGLQIVAFRGSSRLGKEGIGAGAASFGSWSNICAEPGWVVHHKWGFLLSSCHQDKRERPGAVAGQGQGGHQQEFFHGKGG